jgi:hypothetical protein
MHCHMPEHPMPTDDRRRNNVGVVVCAVGLGESRVRQRCRSAWCFFALALFASVGATLVLSAPCAEAAQVSDVTFGGSSVNYTLSGNTVVLTAATIHNYFTATSNGLRMELWANVAPYSGAGGNGYKMAEYPLAPLAGGSSYTNVNSGPIAVTSPPEGVYYIVIFLTEYNGSTVADDGYVADDFVNFPGTVTVGNPLPTALAVEYYYQAWNFYFVTAFPDEIAALDGGAFGGAWKRTGRAFQVWTNPNAMSTPTCRFFSSPTAFAGKSSHFYTPIPAECQDLQTDPTLSSIWQLETPAAFYLAPTDANGNCSIPGTIPLYRVYDNGMGGAPNHRYTISTLIQAQMVSFGWVAEGNGPNVIFACVPG